MTERTCVIGRGTRRRDTTAVTETIAWHVAAINAGHTTACTATIIAAAEYTKCATETLKNKNKN